MIDAAVVDASVAIKWWVPEHDSALARRLYAAKLFAPELLALEMASALWSSVTRGALTTAFAAMAMVELDRAPISWTPDRSLAAEALALAQEHRHPVYDCTYVALAERLGLPVITADRRLIGAFRRAGGRWADRVLALDALQ